nr:DUF4157 domain-containing protein [Sulfitobacter algicola]
MSHDTKTAFSSYFDPDLLDQVRYRVGFEGTNLQALSIRLGGADGVTLDNVILFRSDADLTDKHLMAHEIAHVMQYQEWGVGEFARRYVRNPQSVEDEAHQIALSWKPGQQAKITPKDAPLDPVILTLPNYDTACPENAQ